MRKVLVLFIFNCLFLYSNNENQNSDEGSSGSAASADDKKHYQNMERIKNKVYNRTKNIKNINIDAVKEHIHQGGHFVAQQTSDAVDIWDTYNMARGGCLKRSGDITAIVSKKTVETGHLSKKVRNYYDCLDTREDKILPDGRGGIFIPVKQGARIPLMKTNCNTTEQKDAVGCVYVSNGDKVITEYWVDEIQEQYKNSAQNVERNEKNRGKKKRKRKRH